MVCSPSAGSSARQWQVLICSKGICAVILAHYTPIDGIYPSSQTYYNLSESSCPRGLHWISPLLLESPYLQVCKIQNWNGVSKNDLLLVITLARRVVEAPLAVTLPGMHWWLDDFWDNIEVESRNCCPISYNSVLWIFFYLAAFHMKSNLQSIPYCFQYRSYGTI